MSVFPKETVQSIAETVGLNLKDDVANALTQDVEYRLREIVNEAKKFAHHSHRQKLTSEDINHALRVRNVEPIYGYSAGAPSTFKIIPSVQQRLFYLEDREIDLDEVIYGPLPSVPMDVTFTGHWLAIDGIQPSIVQNPTPSDLRDIQTNIIRPHGTAAAQFAPDNAPDLLVKNTLTKELQMYYDKITASLTGGAEDVRNVAVESVRTDPGIQGLVPYFVQFLGERISKDVKNLQNNWAMMRLTRAILDNPNLTVEPYLHQLIPPILTCIVAKRLSPSPSVDDHHSLRRYAANLIAYICTTYSAAYPSLQPRVTKTLLKAFLDSTKGLATHYGALCGLAGLGEQVVEALVRPGLKG
ncbi:hypothetical protein HK097_004652, partial [Rhizophlyctis rosea]